MHSAQWKTIALWWCLLCIAFAFAIAVMNGSGFIDTICNAKTWFLAALLASLASIQNFFAQRQ